MAKRSNPDERLEAFITARESASGEALLRLVRKTLGDRHYRVVGKAAQVAADQLLYDLEADLVAAYRRHLNNPVKKDPHCIAKGAIVRALVTLDSQEHEFFLAGMRYKQPEPVWGGAVDTALDLRISCAMGLVGTGYPRAAVAVAELMNDAEAYVRSGAVRAMACIPEDRAEPVLRLKASIGDAEPEVTGECFTTLLRLNPEDNTDFVAGFLDGEDVEVAHYAALALGESREAEALRILCEAFDQPYVEREFRRILVRAVTLQRTQPAYDWLLAIVRERDLAAAELVIEELAVHRENRKLRERVAAVVDERNDPGLSVTFREVWKIEPD